jgi:hypothetical protein
MDLQQIPSPASSVVSFSSRRRQRLLMRRQQQRLQPLLFSLTQMPPRMIFC